MRCSSNMATWRPQDNKIRNGGEMTKRRDSANITGSTPHSHPYNPTQFEAPVAPHYSSRGLGTRQLVAAQGDKIFDGDEHVNSEVDHEPEHAKVLARNISCSSLSNAVGLRDKANSSVNVYGTRKTAIIPFLRRQEGTRVRQHQHTPPYLRETWYTVILGEDGAGEDDNAATMERSTEVVSEPLQMRWYKRRGADDDLAQDPPNFDASGHDIKKEMGR